MAGSQSSLSRTSTPVARVTASDESPFLEEKQEEEQVCPETINVQTSPGQVPQFA